MPPQQKPGAAVSLTEDELLQGSVELNPADLATAAPPGAQFMAASHEPPKRTLTEEIRAAMMQLWEHQPIHPVDAVQGMAESIRHPYDTTTAVLRAQGVPFERMQTSFGRATNPQTPADQPMGTRALNMVEAGGHGLNYLLPVVGPRIDELQEQKRRGDISMGEFLAGSTGEALNVAAPEMIRGGAKVLRTVAEPLRATKPVQAAADFFKTTARESMMKALGRPGGTGPATARAYASAERVAPELVERGFGAGSQEGAITKARTQLVQASTDLDRALDAVESGKAVQIQPILDNISEVIRTGFNKTSEVIFDEPRQRLVTDLKTKLQNLSKGAEAAGAEAGTVPYRELVEVRRDLDRMIQHNPVEGAASTTANDVGQSASNAIRNELAKGEPAVASMNKEFSFWKNVTDVLYQGRKPTGGAAGFVNPVSAEGVAKIANKVLNSPAYNYAMSNLKKGLADAIAKGDAGRVAQLMPAVMAYEKVDPTSGLPPMAPMSSHAPPANLSDATRAAIVNQLGQRR